MARELPIWVYCSICLCPLLVVVGLTGSIAFTSSGAVTRASAWAQPQDWRSGECKVLATGVACVDRDSHTTCGGFGGNGSVRTIGTGVVVYDYSDIAVCPGSYWCAKEGDVCKCDGEVTFATELFNGTGYTNFDDTTYRMIVSGIIKCGVGLNGLPLQDPAPYWVKHCWCTPRAILQRLGKAGFVWRKPRDCDKAFKLAKDDFSKEQTIVARHLGGNPRAAEVAEEEDDYSWAETAAEAEATEGTKGRSLTANPRRRRTYTYTPWALVEVPPQEDDDFGQRESQVPVFACAYEFGTPEDSLGDYTSDGPYSSWIGDNLWMAKKAAEKALAWAKDSKNKCFVRTVGAAGKDSCSVALDKLEDLVDRRVSGSGNSWNLFWFCVAVFVPTVLCTAYLVAKQYDIIPGRNMATGHILLTEQ